MNPALPYELQCPSCGQVARLPFVRLGAVTRCTACDHRYRVQPGHVRYFRPVPEPPRPVQEAAGAAPRRRRFSLSRTVHAPRARIALLALAVCAVALMAALWPDAQETPATVSQTPQSQAVQATPPASHAPDAPDAPDAPPSAADLMPDPAPAIGAVPIAGSRAGLHLLRTPRLGR